MLAKRGYASFPNLEATPKPVISSADILSMLNSLTRHVMLRTFERIPVFRQIAKVHRFLDATLPPYKEKCTFRYKEYERTEDLTPPILDEADLVAFWHQLLPGQLTSVFYCLGAGQPPPKPEREDPPPEGASPSPLVEDKAYELEVKEAQEVLFGWAYMQPPALGALF